MRHRGVAVLAGSLVLWLLVGVSLGSGVAERKADAAAPPSSSLDVLATSTTNTTTTTTTAPAAPPPPSAPPVAAASDPTVADSPTGPSRVTRTGRTPPVVGRIIVPRLGLDTTTYDGGDLAQIDWGPSHMPGTAYPGRLGNTVFAGHRVTHTHPFRDLGELQPGDRLTFVGAGGTFTYAFTRFEIVTEDGVEILRQTNDYSATLFACHPPGSDQYRIVAHFRMLDAPTVVPTTQAPAPGSAPTTPTTKPKPIKLPKR